MEATLEAFGKKPTSRLTPLAERCSPKVREKIQRAVDKQDVKADLKEPVLALMKELANSKGPNTPIFRGRFLQSDEVNEGGDTREQQCKVCRNVEGPETIPKIVEL